MCKGSHFIPHNEETTLLFSISYTKRIAAPSGAAILSINRLLFGYLKYNFQRVCIISIQFVPICML